MKRAVKARNRSRKETTDLHMHSIFSDGLHSVEELIDMASARNLTSMAITDHDNIDSFEKGHLYANSKGIEYIPGVEISAVHAGKDIHILGYYFDPTNLNFNIQMQEQSRNRSQRIKLILKKLAALDIKISYEMVKGFSKNGVLGRPHIAMALLKEEYVSSFSEAFNKYLGDQGAAFIEKKGLTVEQSLQLIRRAGGISVMAHPHKTNADSLIPEMVKMGLGGIETYCHSQKGNVGRKYREIAKKHQLVCSGGSDFHGDVGGGASVGSLKIPHSVTVELKEHLELHKSDWF
jgi:hypothetical protein